MAIAAGRTVADLRKGLPGARQKAEKPDRGIDRVVVTEIAVGDEDVPAHLAGQQRAGLRHPRLDQRMSGAPHHRNPAEAGDLVEQGLARLHVGDHRRAGVAGQHVARQQHQDLIAPQDAADAVDDADPVAVAVERDAELAPPSGHRVDQLPEIVLHGGIGVVRGERSVDLLVEQDVRAGQARAQHPHRFAGRPVACIPGDLERTLAVVVQGNPLDIGIENRSVLPRPATGFERSPDDDPAEPRDVLAVERAGRRQELEAVVVGRVVGARDHHAGIGLESLHREIKHRGRAETDADRARPGARQTVHQSRFERGRMEPPVIADADRPAPGFAHDGSEGAPDRLRVVRRQSLADDPADVVGAQDRRIEPHAEPSTVLRPTLR